MTKAAGACVLAGGLAALPRRRTLPIDPDTHAMPTAPRLSLPLALALLVAPALHAQEPPPPPPPIGSGVTPGTVAAAAGDAARPEAAYRPAPFLYYAPVTAVEGTGAVVLATVDATEWPVAVGDRGEVWTNGTTGHHAYGGQLLGTAEVVEGGGVARVRVTLDHPDDPELALHPGDLVALPVVLPEGAFPGYLLLHALLGITWTDPEGRPLFALDEFLAVRTPEEAQGMLGRFAAAVRADAERHADAIRTDPRYAVLLEPRPAGPYAGRTAFDVMREADAVAAARFLSFVLTFPEKYMGGAWEAGGAFATWAALDSPFGSQTLLRHREAAGPDALFAEAFAFAPGVYYADWHAEANAVEATDPARADTLRVIANTALWAYQDEVAAAYGGDYGFVLLLQGRLTEALAHYEETLEVARERGYRELEAATHHNLATVLVRLGDFAEGLRHWALADSLFDALGDPIGRANALFPKANAHFFQGDYAAARETIQGLIEVHRAANWEDPATSIALVGVGETYLEEGQPAEAEHWMEEGLEVARRIGDARAEGFARFNLGRLRLALGRPEEAEADLLAALPLAEAALDEETQARAQNVLAHLYLDAGRLDAAEAAIERARLRGSTAPHFRWEPLYTLALVRLRQGRDAEAVALLEEAVDVLEGLRLAVVGGAEAQRLFAGGGPRARVYQTLIETYQRLGRADDVVRATLRWNQETTQAQQRSARAAVDDPRVQAAAAEERQRRNAVEAAEREVAAAAAAGDEARLERAVSVRNVAEADYRRFVREVIGGDPALAALVPQGVDLQGLMSARMAIPDDAVVLLYMVGADRLFAITVTRTATGVKDIAVSYDEVEALVRDLRAHLATHPGADPDRTEVLGAPSAAPAMPLDEVTDRLYALLVAPVEAELAGRARVAVIPGGPLQLLPFAALRGPDGRYLVERFVLSTVPNFNPFAGEPAAGPLRIRAFANPPGANLPNTVAEVDDLRRLYPDAEVFVADEATEDRAKDIPEAVNVLHFATHGTLDAKIEDSYLMLAPNPAADEDGAFRLNEMDPLVDARAGVNPFRLVTLSACNTAVGNLARSGWPFNPASQFLYASRAVVASLWAVDDAATARLMTAFYRGLAETDAAAALQAAQLELLADERYRHPYYWAPFVLFGDDR